MNSSIYHISHSARKQFKTNATLTKFNYDVQIIKENQLTKAFIEIGKEFCRETSLHGMKHIVKKKYQNMKKIGIDDTILNKVNKKTFIESTVWTIACILGAAFALVLMNLVWTRFQTTPTVTTVETTNFPIWEISFPAVTICNINKVYAPNTINVTNHLLQNNIPLETVNKFFENLSKLINPDYIDTKFLNIYEILEAAGYTSETLMMELAQPCEALMKKCLWLGNYVPCNQFFRLTKSTEGFCCSFNYRALKDSLELPDDMNMNSEPIYRVFGAGRFAGLSLLLDIDESNYIAVSRPLAGAEIIIHDPDEFPQKSLIAAFAQIDKVISLAIIPSVVVSQPAIRNLPLTQRECWFNDEKKLRTTKKYSMQSCMTECVVDTIIKICHCIPFYYPDLHLNYFAKKNRQCTLRDVNCLRDNRNLFSSIVPPPDFFENYNNSAVGMQCDCMPNCSEQQYHFATISGNKFKKINESFSFGNATNYSILHVYFQDLNCIKYRRDTYMTWDGLFAALGGIFGLCLGGSVISLVEFIYYFTFKLFIYIKTYHSKNKTKPFQKSMNKKLKRNVFIN